MTKRYKVEADSGLKGPFPLDEATVRKVGATAGVYVLAERVGRSYVACYIGRSDSLRRRLSDHVGRYSSFYIKYIATGVGAYFAECDLFHKYGKASCLDNKVHPAVPKGVNLPPCSQKGCLGEPY